MSWSVSLALDIALTIEVNASASVNVGDRLIAAVSKYRSPEFMRSLYQVEGVATTNADFAQRRSRPYGVDMAIDRDGNPMRTALCGTCGARRAVHDNNTMTNHTRTVRANTRHGARLDLIGRGSQPRRVHCMGSGKPPKINLSDAVAKVGSAARRVGDAMSQISDAMQPVRLVSPIDPAPGH